MIPANYTIFGRDYQSLSFNNEILNTNALTNVGLYFKPDGTKMYIQWHSGYSIKSYNLSTPWDISTAVFEKNGNITVGRSLGIYFKPDGTKVYARNDTVADAQTKIVCYNLSTPWDINTMSFHNNFNPGFSGSVHVVLFSSDGTKLYVQNTNGTQISQFTMSTAWDISTATLNYTTTNNVNVNGLGAIMSSDGLNFYSVGNKVFTQKKLSTAWDLRTVTVTKSVSLSAYISESGNFHSMFIKPDGTKLYYNQYVGAPAKMYGFELSTPFEL